MEKAQKNRIKVAAIVAGLVVLLIVVAIFTIVGKSNTNNSQTTPAQSTTQRTTPAEVQQGVSTMKTSAQNQTDDYQATKKALDDAGRVRMDN